MKGINSCLRLCLRILLETQQNSIGPLVKAFAKYSTTSKNILFFVYRE